MPDRSPGGGRTMQDWRSAARDMVESQLIPRNIRNKEVLKVMASLPRHLFVPFRYAEDAYIDRPLPIGGRQTISQPYMVAKMTELLEAEKGMKVLEIGTGSGYQSAVLASMGLEVWSVERVDLLARRAQKLLSDMGFGVKVFHGDGRLGWAEAAPFDRVIVTAASERVEPAWEDQLAPGGHLVVPQDVMTGGQRLLVRRKGDAGYSDTWYDYCRFVPLLEGKGDKGAPL